SRLSPGGDGGSRQKLERVRPVRFLQSDRDAASHRGRPQSPEPQTLSVCLHVLRLRKILSRRRIPTHAARLALRRHQACQRTSVPILRGTWPASRRSTLFLCLWPASTTRHGLLPFH